jgi:prolycopene isomerase
LLGEIAAFYDPESKGMPADPADFPDFYPTWASMLDKMKINKVKTKKTKTLAELMDEYNLQDPGLRAVLGQSWIYYGLPPSQIPAWFYLMFTGLFHGYGSYYIQGTSQSLSDALVKTVMDGGGEVILGTEVDEIIIDNGKAVGVKANGEEYFAKAVVSNASVPQTFDRLMPASKEVDKLLKHYRARISEYQPGTSHFNVWLGLDLSNEDLSKSYEELGSSTLVYPSYNHDVPHDTLLGCDPEQSIVAVLAYDNLPSIDASPSGYGSVTLSMLSGYEPWKKFEAVYKAFHSSGDEDYVDEDGLTIEDYNIQKRNITEALIDLVKKQGLLPGLSDEMIVMKEASTPLTNVRYTLNPQGAIYGYEQTKDNSAFSRLGHKTPIEGLYLASAWAYPGGGFETVVLSGKGAFKSMIDDGIIS